MPSTLITTPGAPDANAYCTVIEADAYHDDLPRPEVRLVWTASTPDDKSRAILSATRLIDRAVEFEGARRTWTQPLAWPRYVTVPIGLGYGVLGGWVTTEYYIDPTTIPDRVKQATAEYARQLINEDRTMDSEVGNQGIKSLKADVLEIVFQDGLTSKPIPDAVALLLTGLGSVIGWGHTVRLRRA